MIASELRIGNYLQDREGTLCRVECLGTDAFGNNGVDAPTGKGRTALPVTPTPLTPEWLEKFGFIHEGVNIGWRSPTGWLHLTLNNGFYMWLTGESISKTFHYVHQLQNLYFALTGEELTLTPKHE